MIKKLVLILIVMSNIVWAQKVRHLGRSPRGLLMGDAYTAIADDEYTLFYNPAILARHNFFTFTPMNFQTSVVNPIKYAEANENGSEDPVDMASNYMNIPIHAGVGYHPGFKMGYVDFSGIYNLETNMMLQNQVTPSFDIDHRVDTGFVLGFAYPATGKGYKTDKGGEHLAFGVSLKYIKRQSINQNYNLFSTAFMDALGESDPTLILDSLGQTTGVAYGLDLGMDYAKSIGAGQSIFFGVAVLDPYTLFTTESNDNGYEVAPQPMQMNMGAGYNLDLGALLDITISADFRQFHQRKEGNEYLRDTRLGIEVGNPFINLLAGFNGGYYSYGVQTNFIIFDVFAGFYDVEIGSGYQQTRSDRALFYISLLDFEFTP